MVLSIHASVTLYPTEEKELVLQALKNIFLVDDDHVHEEISKEIINLEEEDAMHVEFETIHLYFQENGAAGASVMKRIHELVRKEYIVESARSVLRKSRRTRPDGTCLIETGLHKQAASKGRVHFADPGESPLGPISLAISGTNEEIEKFIDWLTPPTKDGVVLERHESPPF